MPNYGWLGLRGHQLVDGHESVVQDRDSSTGTETVRGSSICGHVACRDIRWPGKGICHDIGDTRHVDGLPAALSNEGQLSLLPGCPGFKDSVKGPQQRFVVLPQLKLVALQSKPEVGDG